MKTVFNEIWRLAKPYLDTRMNRIHTEISLRYARMLLEREGGEEDIVIPAVILHDVGWKMIPEDQQLKAFGPHAISLNLTKKHEREGAIIARGILEKANHEGNKINEILEIIKATTREMLLSH